MKKIIAMILASSLALLLCACGGGDTVVSEGYAPTFSDSDLDAAWSINDGTQIALSGTSAKVIGEGAAAIDGGVKISEEGTYILSGTMQGRVVVDVESGSDLKLILNGVDITCADSAPLYIANGDAVVVLADGSKNVLTDAATYVYPDPTVEEPNACFYGDDNLSICGNGELFVNANFNNGIGTKDELRIASGKITVNAKNNALKGNDCVLIRDGQFVLESDGDGIKSDNEKLDGYGIIEITGGTIDIDVEDDALQAISRITITDGVVETDAKGKVINCDRVVDIKDGQLK